MLFRRRSKSDVDVPPAARQAPARRVRAPRPGAAEDPRAIRVASGLFALIALGLVGMVARVGQLQLAPHDELTAKIDTQRSSVPLLGRRGNLTDRHGRILATTRVATRLFVDPHLIVDFDRFSFAIEQRLGIPAVDVDRAIGKNLDSRYIVIDRRMSDDRIALMDDFKLPGLATEEYLVRDYPMGELAGQVVGFVGDEGKGLEGAERVLDDRLLADAGRLHYWRDVRRRPIWLDRAGYVPPRDGAGVRLSLDIAVQAILEEQLKSTIDQYDAQAGQMIALDPRTGEVLGMANYPFFDPNQFRTSQPELWRNRSVTDVFEPGSTFKPFAWAAALDAGVAHRDEMFDCGERGYHVFFDRRRLRDAKPLGKITADEILVKSSNIGMAFLGIRLGPQRLHDALAAFGFGLSPGSELPGEARGILRPARQWNRIYSMTSIPMGQEVAVTPLQLARAAAVLANDGLLITPTLLDRPAAYWEREVNVYQRVMPPRTMHATREVLRRAITEGTGRHAASKRYSLWGKTGTAQVPDPEAGGYLPRQYTAVFVGGAPVDQPRIVVVCAIHRPDPDIGYYGGIVAAPPTGRAIDQILTYLGVPPDLDTDAPLLTRPRDTLADAQPGQDLFIADLVEFLDD